MVSRDPARECVRTFGTYEQPGAPDPETERLRRAVADGRARALDVREEHEKLLTDLPTGPDLHLPLSRLNEQTLRDTLAGVSGPVVVYCASGVRSGEVVKRYDVDRVQLFSLPGGIGSG